ncbi:MAG: 30S ribosomal protein S20 [Armatimonadota bacterium]|nr:MAG: 30S ribosomal protein S20 [Armatimonadota bacterium]
MPRIKSAKKQLRKSRQQRLRNQATRSRVKTAVRTTRAAIDGGAAEGGTLVRDACRTIDKATAKGALHKSAAARSKSRLMKRANKATA